MPRPRKSHPQIKTVVKSQKTTSKKNRFYKRLDNSASKKTFSSLNVLKKTTGLVLILLGIFFLLLPRILTLLPEHVNTTTEPIQADSTFTNKVTENDIPTRIIIPSVSIDLPVTLSELKNGYWIPSETTASFGQGSSLPHENSNTVIFAHAREGLFLPLKDVKIGDSVYVLTDSEYVSYTIETIDEVRPTDVYTVKPTEDKRLTLFTCSGFLDQKRLLVVAKPI